MSPWDSLSDGGAAFLKAIATAVEVPKDLAEAAVVASLGVAERCLELIDLNLAMDMGRFKETLLRRREAKVHRLVADGQKRAAEAAEASCRATAAKRTRAERMARERLELESLELKNDTERARAEKLRAECEALRQQTISESRSRLLEAVSRLNQRGGGLGLSRAALEQMLNLAPEVDGPHDAIRLDIVEEGVAVVNVVPTQSKASRPTREHGPTEHAG